MTDPKQPTYVPVVAATGGNYSAPTKRWDATPIIVEPSIGTQAAGLAPDKGSWFTAQTGNFLFNQLGAHLEAIADAATFERRPQTAYAPGTNTLSNTLDTSNGNGNAAADPPLIFPSSDDYVIVQHANPSSGSSGRAMLMYWREGQGVGNDGAGDSFAWKIPSATGGTTLAPAESGKPVVLVSNRASANVLACGASRATGYSADRGETYSAGQSLPASANWHNPLCGCVMNGVWYVVDDVTSSVTVSRLNKTTDPSSVAWTAVGSSIGGTNTGSIRRIVQGRDRLVLLPAANTNMGYWREGDASLTAFRIAAADGTRTGWRGAWNEQIGLFMIGNLQGDLWTSADAITWSQAVSNGHLADGSTVWIQDMVAHGRGFVVSNNFDLSVSYLSMGHDGNWNVRKILTRFPGTATGYDFIGKFHLHAVGGRWMAAQVNKPTGGTFVLEWYYGGVNAFDRNSYVGR